MREIVLDTETTGLDPAAGDRIVEIGAVELVNGLPTGASWHRYINPERPMPPGAFAVHGLGDDFLRDKPVFAAVRDAFLGFIADAPLVIHNAAFDIGFLDAELGRSGAPGAARSARWKWRAPGFRARATRSTRCAAASASICRAATCMARCSTRGCWPRSIWS
jgi:DNA polymerase III epsilon subunit